MSAQSTLFEDANPLKPWQRGVIPTEPRRIARHADPATSHAGAQDVTYRSGSQKARLLVAYQEAGWHGLTDHEAAEVAGLTHIGYWKRCADLRNDGAIHPTGAERMGPAGSMVMVCRVEA